MLYEFKLFSVNLALIYVDGDDQEIISQPQTKRKYSQNQGMWK